MPETKMLKLTAEDIQGATRTSARNCPFARAANRLFRQRKSDIENRNITVVGKTSYPANIFLHRTGVYRDIEDRGGEALAEYDASGRMEPAIYTITRRVS
jgi:hypothetical protein